MQRYFFELPGLLFDLNTLGGIAVSLVFLSFCMLVFTLIQLFKRPPRPISFFIYLSFLTLALVFGNEIFHNEYLAVHLVPWLGCWSILCTLEAWVRKFEPLDYVAPLSTILLTLAYWTFNLFAFIAASV